MKDLCPCGKERPRNRKSANPRLILIPILLIAVLATAATAYASTDSLEGFRHYPAETQQDIAMATSPSTQLPTAYFRDVWTAGETYDQGGLNGDTLTAEVDQAGQTLLTWPPITFYTDYPFNGQTLHDCWVASEWYEPLCNGNIEIEWLWQSQCQDGTYAMKFYRTSLGVMRREALHFAAGNRGGAEFLAHFTSHHLVPVGGSAPAARTR